MRIFSQFVLIKFSEIFPRNRKLVETLKWMPMKVPTAFRRKFLMTLIKWAET